MIEHVVLWSTLAGVPASLRWWTDYDVPWPVALAWIGTVIVAFCLALWAVYSQQSEVDRVRDQALSERMQQRRIVAAAIRDLLTSRAGLILPTPAQFSTKGALPAKGKRRALPEATKRRHAAVLEEYRSKIKELRAQANLLVDDEAVIIQGICITLETIADRDDPSEVVRADAYLVYRLASIFKVLTALAQPQLTADEIKAALDMMTITPLED